MLEYARQLLCCSLIPHILHQHRIHCQSLRCWLTWDCTISKFIHRKWIAVAYFRRNSNYWRCCIPLYCHRAFLCTTCTCSLTRYCLTIYSCIFVYRCSFITSIWFWSNWRLIVGNYPTNCNITSKPPVVSSSSTNIVLYFRWCCIYCSSPAWIWAAAWVGAAAGIWAAAAAAWLIVTVRKNWAKNWVAGVFSPLCGANKQCNRRLIHLLWYL